MRGRTIAAATSVALLAAPLVAQQPPPASQPTFRAGVELVQIDAVVTDRDGNPVSGLTVDDFELREQGHPRDIAAFATVDIPIERADRALYSPKAIEPDVASNLGPGGRVYVIAFDDVTAPLALRTRHFLRGFIETQMGANDIAAIAYLGKGAAHSQDFTGSRRRLLTQLDKFTGAFETSGGSEAEHNLQNRMATFRDLTEALATIEGRRKAVLLVSEGQTMFDAYDIVDGVANTIAADYARAAMVAATRGNVVVYPIDPRGLTVDGASGEAEAAPEIASVQSAQQQGLASRSNLRALARLTGGFAVTNTNLYVEAFERLVRENSSYYILGFYSGNDKRDGKFRSVDVRVKRRGLEVRARTGYVAPMKKTKPAAARRTVLTDSVNAALSSMVARQDVGMKVFAAPFKDEGKRAVVSVAVQVDPASLDLVERNGVFSGQLELAVTATRGRDRFPGVYHVADLALKRDTYEAGQREGLRILTDIQLPPGTYQIRAAAGNRVNRAGSVVADLDVPDFRKGALALSGVLLSSMHLPAALTVRGGKTLGPAPTAPTTSREFTANDTIGLFFEVYDNLKTRTPHSVDIITTLRADDGRVLMTKSEQRSSAELSGRSGGFGVRTELPLDGNAPGLYVIHVDARANTGDRPGVSRDVQIRIR